MEILKILKSDEFFSEYKVGQQCVLYLKFDLQPFRTETVFIYAKNVAYRWLWLVWLSWRIYICRLISYCFVYFMSLKLPAISCLQGVINTLRTAVCCGSWRSTAPEICINWYATLLVVLQMHLSSVGDCNFPVTAALIWNSLQTFIQLLPSVKAHLCIALRLICFISITNNGCSSDVLFIYCNYCKVTADYMDFFLKWLKTHDTHPSLSLSHVKNDPSSDAVDLQLPQHTVVQL